jgi:hypothetical protein
LFTCEPKRKENRPHHYICTKRERHRLTHFAFSKDDDDDDDNEKKKKKKFHANKKKNVKRRVDANGSDFKYPNMIDKKRSSTSG